MKRDVFCLSCSHCDWIRVETDLRKLSSVGLEYDGYCPECGYETITFVEFEDKLWRFDDKKGEWVENSNPEVLDMLRELAVVV